MLVLCTPLQVKCYQIHSNLIGVFFTDPSQDQRGNLGVPMDISSPITSDEEYLSPLEEGMDFSSYRGPEPRKIVDTRFKEPPAFQVSENETEMLKYYVRIDFYMHSSYALHVKPTSLIFKPLFWKRCLDVQYRLEYSCTRYHVDIF